MGAMPAESDGNGCDRADRGAHFERWCASLNRANLSPR